MASNSFHVTGCPWLGIEGAWGEAFSDAPHADWPVPLEVVVDRKRKLAA